MILRLNKKELLKLIEVQEVAGTDATELRSLLAEVEQDEEHIVIVTGSRANDEEYLAEKRGQSQVEHGTGLECMICHQKFDRLLSGTCEVCFKKWVLSTRKRD